MTVKLDDNKITIKQGNSFNIPLLFNLDITRLELIFLVKNKDEEAYLIEKTFNIHEDAINGITNIYFTSEETDLAIGWYKLEILLKVSNEEIHTLFPSDTYDVGHLIIVDSMAKELNNV